MVNRDLKLSNGVKWSQKGQKEESIENQCEFSSSLKKYLSQNRNVDNNLLKLMHQSPPLLFAMFSLKFHKT